MLEITPGNYHLNLGDEDVWELDRRIKIGS